MRDAWLLAMFAAGMILVFIPCLATAEVRCAESIEWVTVDSDRIIVGKVIKVESVASLDKKMHELATIAVSKTFKGKAASEMKVLLHNYNGPIAKEWMSERWPMLFFLVKGVPTKRNAPLLKKTEWVLRYDGKDHCAVSLRKTDCRWNSGLYIMSRRFTILRNPDAILNQVKKCVTEQPRGQKPKGHLFNVPSRSTAYKESRTRDGLLLTLPIDKELETQGRNSCLSPSTVERIEGVKVLRHFPNDQNRKLLVSLLLDPGHGIESNYQSVPGQEQLKLVYRKKVYPVRQLAHQVLLEWGIKVRKPVLEELEGKEGKR